MSKRTKMIISTIIAIVVIGGICMSPMGTVAILTLLGVTFLIGLIIYEILNLLD